MMGDCFIIDRSNNIFGIFGKIHGIFGPIIEITPRLIVHKSNVLEVHENSFAISRENLLFDFISTNAMLSNYITMLES